MLRCVFVIYRPPGADATSVNYIDSVIQCLSSYCLLSRVNIVTGDLNCTKINWLTSSCPNDSIKRPLLDCITEYGFTQIVDFPTRQGHVLDIVLIDEMQRVLSVTEKPPLSYSDHSSVEFTILIDAMETVRTASSSGYYLWRNGDFASINTYLTNVDWFDILCRFPAACDMWRAFASVVSDAVNQFVPTKQRICRHKIQLKPQYPKEIR